MTAAQRKKFILKGHFANEDHDGIASIYYGIYDRITDWGHGLANIVVAPAAEDGSGDWERASPLNLEQPSSDSGPADMDEVRRWAVLVDEVDGCSSDTSVLLWLNLETGDPCLAHIAGPEADGDIAMRIISRDVGITPPPKEFKPSPLVESLQKLTAELSRPLPAVANDNKPSLVAKPADPTFPVICPADWHGKPVPAREWYAEDLIPNRQVTIVSGDGGVGKSLLTLQVAAAGALGVETMGMRPSAGRVVYLGAEDEADEFHRRLDDIVMAHDKELRDLSDFRLVPMADLDALLARPDMRMNMQPTPLYSKLVDLLCDVRPKLVVLDTAADLFGGDEIKRNQVRQFIGLLRQLAIGLDCAVVLLTHPSVAGMQSGTGSSGSTAWNNSVRIQRNTSWSTSYAPAASACPRASSVTAALRQLSPIRRSTTSVAVRLPSEVTIKIGFGSGTTSSTPIQHAAYAAQRLPMSTTSRA